MQISAMWQACRDALIKCSLTLPSEGYILLQDMLLQENLRYEVHASSVVPFPPYPDLQRIRRVREHLHRQNFFRHLSWREHPLDYQPHICIF